MRRHTLHGLLWWSGSILITAIVCYTIWLCVEDTNDTNIARDRAYDAQEG